MSNLVRDVLAVFIMRFRKAFYITQAYAHNFELILVHFRWILYRLYSEMEIKRWTELKLKAIWFCRKLYFSDSWSIWSCKCLFSCWNNFTTLKSTILLPENCVKCDQRLHVSQIFWELTHMCKVLLSCWDENCGKNTNF